MKSRLTLAVLTALLLTCVFYACRKDLSGKSAKLTAASITDPAVPLDIGLAKKYYHNLRKEQGDAVPATAAAISAGHPKNRKYVLFKAAYMSETPSYTFVEAPLFFNQKPTTVIKPAGQTADIKADLPVIQGNLSRLVIYKSKRTGQVDQRILTYIPDVSYLARHHNDISRNHVNALDSDYNGYIKYQNWAGKTLFLLKIKNGRSVKRYSSAYNSVKNKKITTSAEVCEDLVDISYIETCYYADPEGTTEYCIDSDFEYYYHTDCYDDGTGDPDCFETGDCYDPGCNSCDPPADPPGADHELPKSKIPPKSGAATQAFQTCVFKTMEWISKFYGGSNTVGSMMLAYSQTVGTATSTPYGDVFNNILLHGVGSSELGALTSMFFNTSSTSNLFTSIDNGYPIMGTILNSSGDGHEVMITGYNNNGTMEYFDPYDSKYHSDLTASQFHNVIQITGKKP